MEKVNTLIIDTPALEQKLYERLMTVDTLAIDLETTGFNPRTEKTLCIGLSWSRGNAVAIPMYHREAIFRPNFLKLKEAIENKRLIFHNGKFDIKFLKILGWNVTQYFDTMLAHYIVDDEKQGTHSLDQVGAFLGWTLDKMEPRKYLKSRKESFEKVPLAVLLPYCGADAGVTYAIYDYYKDKVPHIFHYLIMPAVNAYTDMELQGVKVDVEYALVFDKQLEIDIDTQLTQMQKEFGLLNFNSHAQLCKLFYDDLKLKYHRRSVDAEALEVLASQHKIANEVRELRRMQFVRSHYTKKVLEIRDENDFVHPDFLFHGTVNGRLSCAGDFNLMAIDREDRIKRIFRGSGDCLIMECDYRAIELKLAAYLSGDQKMIALFRDGRDFHSEMGSKLYNKPISELTETNRVITKMVVFGVLYGRGAKSIADEWHISEKEAAKYIDMLFKEFPNLENLVNRLKVDGVRFREAHTLQGRIRRWRSDYPDWKLEKEATNFPFASLASDITLTAAVLIDQFYRKNRMRSRVLWTVHDAIVQEIAPNELALAARAARSLMLLAPLQWCPDLPFDMDCKIEVGVSWGDCEKYKFEQVENLSNPQLKLWGYELDKEIFDLSDLRSK